MINLSSTTIALNLPGYAAYIGSKAAVEGFTRVFAKGCVAAASLSTPWRPGRWPPNSS